MCKKSNFVKSPIKLHCIVLFSIITEHWDVVLDLHPDENIFLILTNCKTRLVSNIQISYQTFVVGTFL